MIKLSKYSVIKECGKNKILFNTLSLGLLELNEEYSKKLEELLNGNDLFPDLKKNLEIGGFISDDSENLQLLKYLNYKSRYQKDTLALTIAPTMECNFKCTYCYEEGCRYNTMKQEIKEQLLMFVENSMNNIKNLDITWYGGEPLLQIKTIEYLTTEFRKLCEKYNVNYHASIISNGYLLDRKMAQRLSELDIKNVQITLDGPKEIHDSRRMLLNDKGTYDRIIENITHINDLIFVSIRMNIDETNKHNAYKVLEDLKERGLSKKVFIYVAQVDDVNNSNLTKLCTVSEEFGSFEIEFLKKARQYGFDNIKLPHMNIAICGAVMENAFVIDPLGNLYKCYNTIGRADERVGHISDGNFIGKNLFKWMNYNSFNSECNECNVQPICLGGCPYQRLQSGKHNCNKVKYNIEDLIGLYRDKIKNNVVE